MVMERGCTVWVVDGGVLASYLAVVSKLPKKDRPAAG